MLRRPAQAALVIFALLAATGASAKARHAKPPVPNVEPQAFTPLIAAAEPLAAEAGMAVLKRGGTAADAAVAVQAMLGLIEPQSSGLGGGSFMLYYDAKTGTLSDYNGREVAPAGATPDMFLGPDGRPMPFSQAVVSGRATGVPGAMFMLDKAQKDHGKLAWSGLFDAAIQQADKGFAITPRLGNYLQNADFAEKHTTDFAAYLGDGQGGFRKTGDIIKNPDYAASLRLFAKVRGDAFRKGPLAEAIVTKTHADPLPGTMTLSDLASYKVKVTQTKPYKSTQGRPAGPLCIPYRLYIVCSNGAPSGGVALLQGLLIAANFPLDQWGVHDPRAWQGLIEAERLMYADRDQYEGDTADFYALQTGYLDQAYAKSRAGLVRIGQVNTAPAAGMPPAAQPTGPDKTIEPGGTSHFVIRDRYGNVLSMTTTVESFFGTGRMAGGFFLNNQLTDFSFSPKTAAGLDAANAVAGGKHPRSSMSPVIVFAADGKTVVAAVGSPGGSAILAYNLKVLVGILDWRLSMQDAINLPNVVARGEQVRIEQARMEPAVWDGLTTMGYKLLASSGEESGLNGFLRGKDGSFGGGSDPRREGVFIRGK
jgi:gamma-glutamyltranspeptidase/glutathione hydrolase